MKGIPACVLVSLASFCLGLLVRTMPEGPKPPLEEDPRSAVKSPIRRLTGGRGARAPNIDVVCVLAEYRIGRATCDQAQFDTFLAAGVKDFRRSVTGFKFTVTEPERFRGKILTMSYDGMLASGDPLYHFYFGHRYVIKVSESRIGLDDYDVLY